MLKKIIAFFLSLLLTLTITSCKESTPQDSSGDITESYCYVSYVTTNGFAAHINDIGCVFIEHKNANKQIELFDTVIVKYHTSDLTEDNGSYIGVAGEKETYSYRIKNPKSVRLADPSKGEPVFG